MVATGSKYKKNGAEYLKINKVDTKMKLSKINMYFEDLFKNDKELTKVANNAINENSEMFINDALPVFEATSAKMFIKSMNDIFGAVPMNVFFP